MKPFIPYITTNTRWGYSWNMTYEHRIKVDTYNYWIPKTAYKDKYNGNSCECLILSTKRKIQIREHQQMSTLSTGVLPE